MELLAAHLEYEAFHPLKRMPGAGPNHRWEVLPGLWKPQTRFRPLMVDAPSILERKLVREELLKAGHERLVRSSVKDRKSTPGSLERLREGLVLLDQDLSGRICSGGTFGYPR